MTTDEKQIERIAARMREVPDRDAAMDRVWRRIHEPRPSRLRLRLAAAAVSIVVVLGAAALLASLWRARPGAPTGTGAAADVVMYAPGRAEGDVIAGRGTPRKELTAGSGATIRAAGLATIAVLDDARFAVARDALSFRMDLRAGRSRFEVADLKPGFRFNVVTPHAEIRVKGTVFQVSVSAERTELSVAQGEVLWISGGKTQTVGAGQGASSGLRAETPHGPPPVEAAGKEAPAVPEEPPAPAGAKVALKSPPKANGKAVTVSEGEIGASFLAEARSLLSQKKYAEALSKLESAQAAVASREEREDLLFTKGQVELLNLGRARDAVTTFSTYLGQYPSGTYVQEALFHVAEAYGRLDDFDNAAAWFSRFVQESRDDGRRSAARYNVGALALRLKGDCEEALKWFGLALVMPAPDIERKALSGAVQCHVRLNRREGLAPLVERLERVSPRTTPAGRPTAARRTTPAGATPKTRRPTSFS